MRFAVLAIALTEETMFRWGRNFTPVRANGLERRLASSRPGEALRRRWDTLIMTGSELNKLRISAFICGLFLLCLGESARAQSSYSLRSPDQKIEVRIRAADRLSYDVLLNGAPLLQNSTL